MRLPLSALALLLATASAAGAQDRAIRDRAGRTTGTAVERPDGGYDLRRRDGKTVGRADPIPGSRPDPRADLSRPEWWRSRR